MNRPPIIWETHEYEHRDKTADWYWAVGIIALSTLIISLLFGNYILSILVIVAGLSIGFLGNKEPHHVRFEINNAGLLIDNNLFPFGTLDSFWVINNDHLEIESKLLVKSKKLIVPMMVIPLVAEIDPEEIRAHLLGHIDEEEHHIPLSHKMLEYLGF